MAKITLTSKNNATKGFSIKENIHIKKYKSNKKFLIISIIFNILTCAYILTTIIKG